jgi:hypothetical protein
MDDLFNILVYKADTGGIDYYIDCDMEPYCFDNSLSFVVGGKRTYYNYNIQDTSNKSRVRIPEGLDGVIEYSTVSFDPKLPIGVILARINSELNTDYRTANEQLLLTSQCKIIGSPPFNFRSFDTSQLLPSTTVMVDNIYSNIGYRDCIAASGDYVLFDKLGTDTSYPNRNPVLITNQRRLPDDERGFSAQSYVSNPALQIKFSGITPLGLSVIINTTVNVVANESAASLLIKLNALSSHLVFSTTQTSAIENTYMSYNCTFNGEGILNVTINNGVVFRGCKPSGSTFLYFVLTDAQKAQIRGGSRLSIYINNIFTRVDMIFSGEYLYATNGSSYTIGTIHQDRGKYYIQIASAFVYKAELTIGTKIPDFSNDYLYQRISIYDSSDCIYHLFNQNNSKGLYMVEYNKPFFYNTGYVNADDDIGDSGIFMGNLDYTNQYRYICYLDYFLAFNVITVFPEQEKQYKPFGKVVNGKIELKGKHPDNGFFSDILHHSSGRVYALGRSLDDKVDFPGTKYPIVDSYFAAYDEYSQGFNSDNKVQSNLFELDPDTLLIKKAVCINNWVYLPLGFLNVLYLMYRTGGLREIGNQIWVGNIEYSTDLSYVKHHSNILYTDMIDNQGELVILLDNILAVVDYDGNCRWAYDFISRTYDADHYNKRKQETRSCSEPYLSRQGKHTSDTDWTIEGARARYLEVDPDGNIYVAYVRPIDPNVINGSNHELFKFDWNGNILFTTRDPFSRSVNRYYNLRYKDNKLYALRSREQRKRRLPTIRLVVADTLTISESL